MKNHNHAYTQKKTAEKGYLSRRHEEESRVALSLPVFEGGPVFQGPKQETGLTLLTSSAGFAQQGEQE